MTPNSKTAAHQDTAADDTAPRPAAEAEAAAPTDAAAPAAAGPAETGPAGAEPAAAPDAAERLAELEAELAETKDRMMRAMAEAENTRRRAERDRQETSKYAIASFAREMLSVADNLGRALSAVDPEVRESSSAAQTLLEGVEMTAREMQKTLERQGIKRIEAEGELLDPNLHEAMFEIPDDGQPQGTVVQVVEDGYTLHDRLLRPAKVGVAKGGPKPQPKAEADAGSGKTGTDAYEAGGDAAGKTYDQEL